MAQSRRPPATEVSTPPLPRVAADPFSDAFLSDPYAYHDELRDAGAVFWLDALGIYGMARHAEVSAALRDWQTFSSERGVGLSDFAKEAPWRPPSLLLETDPPLHDRTRSIMNRIVSLQALKILRPAWQAKAEQLADELVERRRFDLVRDLAEVFPMRVFPDAIGLREEGRAQLLVYASATFNAFGPRNRIFEEANAAATDAVHWVAESCRRENLAPGGWGAALFEAADRGECTADEAERLVRSFLSAGVDTTVNGIGNMMFALATHPVEWAKLRADPGLAKRAFEESLRWNSTVQTFFRTTTREVTIEDAVIPEGSKVLLFLAAANRDPRRWGDRADAFDIGRAASGHVGFGFGIHQCLGQMLARLEGELVLDALIPRIASIRPVGEPSVRLNNTLHALAELNVEVVPA